MQLENLAHPDDDRELVRNKCFEVGWKLRSPDSWEYLNLITGESGTVTIPELIQAVAAKRDRLNPKVVSINKFSTNYRK
jgi:hypothetical protein